MSYSGKTKKRDLDKVIDGTILVAKATKGVGDTPVLAPLKASMGSVIKLLENVQVSRLCSIRSLIPHADFHRNPGRTRKIGHHSLHTCKNV
jgi:hypothetical protein